jgi:hypothetical protein
MGETDAQPDIVVESIGQFGTQAKLEKEFVPSIVIRPGLRPGRI